MMSRLIGLGLFFVHVGLFHIAAAALAFAVIPWMVLVYVAGFLSNARPWPEMKDVFCASKILINQIGLACNKLMYPANAGYLLGQSGNGSESIISALKLKQSNSRMTIAQNLNLSFTLFTHMVTTH